MITISAESLQLCNIGGDSKYENGRYMYDTNVQGVEMPETALCGSGTRLRGKTCGWDKREKVHAENADYA